MGFLHLQKRHDAGQHEIRDCWYVSGRRPFADESRRFQPLLFCSLRRRLSRKYLKKCGWVGGWVVVGCVRYCSVENDCFLADRFQNFATKRMCVYFLLPFLRLVIGGEGVHGLASSLICCVCRLGFIVNHFMEDDELDIFFIPKLRQFCIFSNPYPGTGLSNNLGSPFPIVWDERLKLSAQRVHRSFPILIQLSQRYAAKS